MTNRLPSPLPVPGPFVRRSQRGTRSALAAALAALLLPAGSPAAQVPASAAKTPPKIIIKVDDLGAGRSLKASAQWQRLADFIKARKIQTNIGVICDSLEGNKPEYIRWIKDLHDTGFVEFWLHAYEHKSWTDPAGVQHNEFAARSYEEQLQRFEKCQQLAKDKLGFVFHTFGPPGTGTPGPAIDENTCKAMQAQPDLKVWLYAMPLDKPGKQLEALGKVTILDRVFPVNIEHPLFVPSLAEFQKGYEQYADKRDYFVIQGHPQHWSDGGFAEFVKIIDFCTAQGCAFVSPEQYVEQQAAAKEAVRAAHPPTPP